MTSNFYTVLDAGLAKMERKAVKEIARLKNEIINGELLSDGAIGLARDIISREEKILDRLGYARNYLCDRVSRTN